MSNPIRIAIAAAAVVAVVAIVAVVGINVLPGIGGFGRPGPTASPSPTPATTPIPFRFSDLGNANLTPGPYVIDSPFPVRITFDVPEGWWLWESRADFAGLLVDNGIGDGDSGWGLVFWIVIRRKADRADCTPPYPDHPSGYDCITGAVIHTARHFFRTNTMPFRVYSGTAEVDRSYPRFTDVLTDTINARIYLGIHFRTPDVQGARLGKRVARWLDDHFFQPVD